MDRMRTVKTAANGRQTLGLFDSFQEVPDVTLCRLGETFQGTLYLSEHHIVLSFSPPAEPGQKPRPRTVWIAYPMVAHCTYRPMPPITRQPSSIRLRCRDFTFVAFQFTQEQAAREVYENIKSLACRFGTLDTLYAFAYKQPKEEMRCHGWEVYDARREYRRMGIGPKEADRGWRISEINHDYTFSPTYPSLLVVPSTVSDNVLKHGGSFRSKYRIPALTYLHPVNDCSITRSSQPMVGIFKAKRNAQDERLVAAIFSTKKTTSNASSAEALSASQPEELQDRVSMQSSRTTELAFRASDDVEQSGFEDSKLSHARSEPDIKAAKVYGAQQRNLIIDARPLLNARVNQAAGMGAENMDYYKDATINYLGIDNIHTMRHSLETIFDALHHSDYTKLPANQQVLAKSQWLKYIRLILRGADLVARQVGVNHSHVLIHCSDGWDRTSQISALSQLCLDPYYRTLEGFIVLVEKDWMSFGHMFRRRSGPLGSEKWFEIENERVGGRQRTENGMTGGTSSGTKIMENALLSAKNFFSRPNDSRESLDPEGEANVPESSPSHHHTGTPSKDDKFATKHGETSPIFHQFLDGTWQLLRQHPKRFEFNERFLKRLLYHLYSCQYGTFLYDNERERVEAKAPERTGSVWDHFLCRKEQFLNPSYDPTVDDKIIGKERLIFPDTNKVRWWFDVFGRSDIEMNGTDTVPAISLPKEDEPVITGIESADVAAGPAANGGLSFGSESNNPFMGGTDRLSSSLSGLGLGRASAPASRPRTPTNSIMQENSEMQTQTPSPTARRNELSFQAFARDSAFRDG